MDTDHKILEWETATDGEQATAQRISEVVGRVFYAYNLPLQCWIDKDEDTGKVSGRILNYMPRKETCCDLSFEELFNETMPSKEKWEDFCNTNIAILGNLIRQWEAIRDGKINQIYYPNTNLEETIRNLENPRDKWDELINPYKK